MSKPDGYVIKSGDLVIGIDVASGDDKSVAVAARKNADGTLTILGVRELEDGSVIDLTADDVTDRKLITGPHGPSTE